MILSPYDTFEHIDYQHRPVGNVGHKIRYVYKDVITAFDIETTNYKELEQSFMYIWQWHFDGIGTVFGRTWVEFTEFQKRLRDRLYGMHLMVYVHNLSFEFQFLKGIYKFTNDEIFSLDRRRILKCTMHNAFEFRCSYLLTNMSLALFLKKMNVTSQKLSGEEFDYNKYRYPWTEINENELAYCRNDVEGLVQGVKVLMKSENDTLYNIPLTSTGYVRRDAKRAMHSVYRGTAKSIIPDFDCFCMLHDAFRGGNTHGNRYYAGKIMHNVKSFDRSSSYPSELCNSLFPMKPFSTIRIRDREHLETLIYTREKPLLFMITFYDIELKRADWGCPYIPFSKLHSPEGTVKDNGRILKAEELTMTITDVDYRIINDEYKFSDIRIYKAYYSSYGMLPKQLRDNVISYFKDKTELKGVEGQEIYYTKQKNKLNSNYGMMAQNPVRDVIAFENNTFHVQEQTLEEMEEKFWKENNKDFLSYAWGVWTTANARYELEKGIKIAHDQGIFLYTDTDSVKGIGEFDLSGYNSKMMHDSIEHGATAYTPKGELKAMGVYEEEDEMSEFITLGAKKYAYRLKENNKLYITIAGVNKIKGAEELEDAGGLDAFHTGFIFKKGGGLESKYNDNVNKEIFIDGHKLSITDNVYMCDSTYTLGVGSDYATLLDNIKKGYKY